MLEPVRVLNFAKMQPYLVGTLEYGNRTSPYSKVKPKGVELIVWLKPLKLNRYLKLHR